VRSWDYVLAGLTICGPLDLVFSSKMSSRLVTAFRTASGQAETTKLSIPAKSPVELFLRRSRDKFKN
jgi:hypothetical protein